MPTKVGIHDFFGDAGGKVMDGGPSPAMTRCPRESQPFRYLV
jgi:hypothetical protein